jgi:uncharacterized glyoxalase superfamily protein PhnB
MSATPFQATGVTTSLTAKDLGVALAWYRDVVGFAVTHEMMHEGALVAAIIHAGGVRLVLNQEDGKRGWDRVKGEGFSFQIETTQNVDEVARAIEARGGTLDSQPADMPWGVRMFRLRDPDGYRLSIAKPLS